MASEKKKHAGGRPELLTPEIQEKIVNAIRLNGYAETAVAFASINKDTFYAWMKRGGRASKGKYREFSDAVNKATAEAEMRMSGVVAKSASGYDVVKTRTVVCDGPDGRTTTTTEEKAHEFDPASARWWLERRFPDRWGPREYREISGGQESPVLIQQQVNLYDPAKMAEMLIAWVEASIIPQSVLALISDNTKTDGQGNGQGPSQAA